MEAYTTKSFGGTATFTMDMLRESVREMDWLNYEVDPEWSRFMEFGPDDIGGVWETLGVIRKRQPLKSVLLSLQMAKKLNEHIERQVLNCSMPTHILGVPAYVSSCVADDKAYLMF